MSQSQHSTEDSVDARAPVLPEQAEPETETGAEPAGVQVTDRAASEIQAILDREKLDGHVLRVSVVGGGCSGLSYRMGFVEGRQEHDRVLQRDGVTLVVDPKSHLYLESTVIDYTDGLNGKGFTFKNPNAVKTCGCGSSFSA